MEELTPEEDAMFRAMAIELANRFNSVITQDLMIERVVVRAVGYMLATNALGSGMERQALVDLLTKVCEDALNGYDLELTTRGRRLN